MPNNVDLIQIIADTGGGLSACSDCDGVFMAKSNSVFSTYIADATSSEKTKWATSGDTATFTLGTLSSTDIGTLTVQGSTDADAIVYVKSNDGSTTSITPTTITVENIAGNPVSALGATTFHSNVLPNATDTYDFGSSSKRWHNIYAENVDLDGTLSVASLTLSGDLTVNGGTTLGNGAGDAITVTGTATFAESAEFNGGVNCDGVLALEGNNVTADHFSITGSSGNASFDGVITQTSAPSSSNHLVRKQDVDLTTATLSGKVAKITVASNFITDAALATGADLPTHASNHATTRLAADAPASSPPLADALYYYDIGAVGRTSPVVKNKLKMTTTTDYDPASAAVVDYFLVIEAGQTPASSGPAGQIIFRKAT